jgi:hypothetical protein
MIVNDVGYAYLQWCIDAQVNPILLTFTQRCAVVRVWRECVDPHTYTISLAKS